MNGQFESVCESVFSELESQAVDALDLPLPGQFRVRSHSYVRAIDQGCPPEGDGARTPCRAVSPPRSATTVRTIQSSTGQCAPISFGAADWLNRRHGILMDPASNLIGQEAWNSQPQSWLEEAGLPLFGFDWGCLLLNTTHVFKEACGSTIMVATLPMKKL